MRGIGQAILRPLLALIVAFLLGGLVIAVTQKSAAAPFAAYGALFSGAFGDPNAWANTLRQTTPLLLTGLAVTVALAAGLFNIGAEGQMAVGALTAAIVGSSLPSMPPFLILLVSLAAGMAAGAAWAFLPALLRVYRGAHEVITAILLNYIAQNVTRFLASGPLRDPSGQSPQTREVIATLPRLLPAFDVHFGLILAIVVVVVVALALRSSVWGFRTRFVGESPGAAEAAGVAVNRLRIAAFVFSGALAGLAGAVTVLGVAPFRRFTADFYGIGYGFDGLSVALLAALAVRPDAAGGAGNAWGVLPAALLFGALGAGAEAMDFNAGVPKQMVQVVQAILIAAVAARFVLPRFLTRKANR